MTGVTPANAAITTRWTTYGLHEMVRYVGKYQASTDGFGESSGTGSFSVLKPTGATSVVAAFLTSAGRDAQGIEAPAPTVTLDGATVSFSHEAYAVGSPSSPYVASFTNYFGDVTSIIQSYFSGSPTGSPQTMPWSGTEFAVPVTYDPNGTDKPTGLSLTVIFNNPTMVSDSSVVVYFGMSDASGQDFALDFQNLSSAPTGSWLSVGSAWSSGGGQYSNIKARNNLASSWTYISGSTGGFDDSASGELITVGGVGDSTTNPVNPVPGDNQPDDELYNLDGFLSAGVQQITLNLTNPSGDDNIFQAVLNMPFPIYRQAAFDTQGGSSVSPVYFMTSFSLPAAPTKAGYAFNGWYSAASGGSPLSGTQTPPGTSGDLTLYAQWTAAPNTVTYDSQGGSAVAQASYATSITLPAAPTRAGYSFDGWFVAASGGSALTSPYAPSSPANITLYAHWSAQVAPVVSYTVTYDSQGGSSVAQSSYLSAITLPSAPVRPGFNFLGWFTSSSGGSALASPFSPTQPANMTLFAHWSPKVFSATFDSRGGSPVPEVAYTTEIELPNPPTRSGYYFVGWCLDQNCQVALAGTFAPESPSNLTFFARWAKNPSKVIAGFADGSSLLTPKMKAQLSRFLSANSGVKSVSCVGQTEGPTILQSDNSLARKRGQAACDYLRKLKPELNVAIVTGKNLQLEAARHRSVLVRLTK
ncbi:MAG: InlB B-repeat-containing protein [Micrococcales bacterium]